MSALAHRVRGSRGQSILELALTLPIMMVIVLGVMEFGYALLDDHVVTRLAREGSNLISRDTTLEDAVTAMKSMSARPVNLDTNSRLILSVIKRGATTGTANYDKLVLYQRREYGALAAASRVTIKGSGAFGGAPDYIAANSDSNTGLQLTNQAADLIATKGGLLYIAEIITSHKLITPLDRFGITVPNKLYSISYF